ncbi:MAG: PEP-CTERM sorting domain-containing protein [Nitrospirales bacterium]
MTARGRIRTGFFTVLAASVISVAVGSTAFANSIDFTDGSWNGAQGQNSFTTHVSNIDLFAAPSQSAKITVNYIGGPSGDNSGMDGLGINDDEITQGGIEQLKVVFETPVMLDSVYITDLFNNEGSTGQAEQGMYSLNGGAFTSFASVGAFNGELTLNIFQPRISSITFKSSNDSWSDYSVKGLTYQIQSVPEPSTLLLLGAGLVGLAAWKRKKAA